MEVGEYLRSKGADPKAAGSARDQYQIRCVFCGDSKNQRHRHLYVNQENGAFKCHRCDEEGGFAALQKQFGDTPAPREKLRKHEPETVYRAAVEIAEDALFDNPEVVKYLNLRGLSADAIVSFRLGYMGNDFRERMLDRFDLGSMREAGLIQRNGNGLWSAPAIIIPYFDGTRITQLRAKQINGPTIGLPGVPTRLFNVNAIREGDEAYICEGEMDTIMLDQYGLPAVGVPGASAFKDLWVRYFNGKKRVFIVPDHDPVNPTTGKRPGIEGARRTAEMIGDKAKIVNLPTPGDISTDIGDFFIRDGHTIEEFLKLIESARGKRLFTYENALVEWEDLLSKEGIQLGFKDLDSIIQPGLIAGQVVILLAKTGVGKTAFAAQVAWNMASSDIPTLMLSLEQMKGEIANRFRRISRYSQPWTTSSMVSERLELFRVNDENRVPPEDIPFLLEEFELETGQRPKFVIVDYLGYWSRSFRGGSQYEQTTAAIMELKNIAKREQVVIFAPHQVSRAGRRGEKLALDFARDSGAVEETGDFVFALHAPSHQDGKDSQQMTLQDRADIRLDILKSRHGGAGKEVRLLFAPLSLAIVPAIKSNMKRVEKEWRAHDESVTFDEFVTDKAWR